MENNKKKIGYQMQMNMWTRKDIYVHSTLLKLEELRSLKNYWMQCEKRRSYGASRIQKIQLCHFVDGFKTKTNNF